MIPKLDLLPIIISVGFLAHLIGLVYFQRKAGINLASTQTIDLLKEQIDAQRTKLKDQNDSILELTKKLSVLEQQIETKDAEVKRITDLLLQRDPNSAQMTSMAITAMKQVNDISAVVKESHEMIITTNKNVELSNKNIERIATSIEKYLKIMERK